MVEGKREKEVRWLGGRRVTKSLRPLLSLESLLILTYSTLWPTAPFLLSFTCPHSHLLMIKQVFP